MSERAHCEATGYQTILDLYFCAIAQKIIKQKKYFPPLSPAQMTFILLFKALLDNANTFQRFLSQLFSRKQQWIMSSAQIK